MQLGVYDLQRNYDVAPVWATTSRWWNTGRTKGYLTPYDVEGQQSLGFVQFVPALAAGITSVVAAVAPLMLAREQRKVTVAQVNADARAAAAAKEAAMYAPGTPAPVAMAALPWMIPAGLAIAAVTLLMPKRGRRR